MNRMSWCWLGAALIGTSAMAADPSHPFQHGASASGTPAAGTRARTGSETRAWLDLQTSGAQASTVERPLPGEIAERSYQRYVKSFEQPLPTEFEREQFVGGSGSR